jgi:hypothetical protein
VLWNPACYVHKGPASVKSDVCRVFPGDMILVPTDTSHEELIRPFECYETITAHRSEDWHIRDTKHISSAFT